MCHGDGMRVTGVDACRRGWVAVSLDGPDAAGPLRVGTIRVHETLAGVLDGHRARVVGIDMPLGLLGSGWREADRAARRRLGPRRSSVFAIPPVAVWEQASRSRVRIHPSAVIVSAVRPGAP
jgi:predicted RNase H-like nuclease